MYLMVEKLDLKDRKILYELDLDSRQSFGRLSKKVGLSKNSVINRVNALQEKGVIKNFKTIIDFGKLGYFLVNFWFDLKSVSPNKEKEIIDFLCNQKIVSRVLSMDGKFNLRVQIISKDMAVVYLLWEKIFEKYINYIEERQITILMENSYYFRPYLLDLKKSFIEQKITSSSDKVELGNIDVELLKILARKARTSIIELSEKLNITPKTVIAHIKKLKKDKLIRGYGLSIDLSKVGYQVFRVSFILHRVTPEKLNHFKEYNLSQPNIVYHERVLGGDDYELEIQVKDMDGLREIIKDIQSNFSDIIQDYQILHVFKHYKGLTFPE